MRRLTMVLGSAFALLVLSVCALAQNSSTSSLAGTVTDSTGAVVPGAVVTVRNLSTQVKHATKTTAAGDYKVLFLDPGLYTVTFEKPGFATLVTDNVRLELDQTGRLDGSLKAGSAPGEVVTVTGAVPILDTDSSALTTVFDDVMVHELPLVGRVPTQLAALSPETSTTISQRVGVGTGGSIDPGRVDVGGARVFSINATLDGAPIVLPGNNNFSDLVPAMDAVSEFSTVQGNFGAQYTNGTSVVSMVLRNGTNHIHGSLFDFIENDAFDARPGFENPGYRNPKLRYNQYGGTIGGPILRNRLFAFFSYQNNRVPSTSNAYDTVPTDAEKSGDFSAMCTGVNAAGQCTYTVPGSNPLNVIVTQLYNPATGQPYPDDKMDSTQFDPVAVAALKYFPEPNYNGPVPFEGNYFRQIPDLENVPIYNGKLSWTINKSHTLEFTSHSKYLTQAYGSEGPICLDTCGTSFQNDMIYQLHEQWTISPKLVNSFAASVVYEKYGKSIAGVGGNYPSKLGLTQNISQTYFPSFSWSGNGSNLPGTSIGPGTQFGGAQDAFTYSDFITWAVGKHSLSIGAMFGARQYNNPVFPGVPSFSFNGQYTALVDAATDTKVGGFGMADFLLGDVQSYSFDEGLTPTYSRNKEFHAFVQDDWRITPTLTLNLGLRYQYQPAWYEAQNHISNFSPTLINPITNTPGALYFASASARSVQNGHPLLFAPRFGFSKLVDRKTLVNGAFGLFYAELPWSTSGNFGWPGYSIQQNLPVGLTTYSTPPVFQLQQGPPPYSVIPPTLNGGIANGEGVTWLPQNAKQPYSEEYHLSVERQLSGKSKVDVSYVGSRGLHLYFPRNINMVPVAEDGSPTDITDPQSLVPFPQYTSITELAFDGISNYNALVVSFDRRFSKDLTILANYTLSHSLDTSSEDPTSGYGNDSQIPTELWRNYGNSFFDVRNRGVLSYVANLPVGKGEQFLNNSGVLSQIVGGWTNSSSFTINSGSPQTIWASGNQQFGGVTGWPFANCLGNSKGPKTSEEWFNVNAFGDPGNYQLGDCARDSVYGPGQWDLDTSLMKAFPVRDVMKIQFRADAFNVFNHRNLNAPDPSIGPGFGQITGSSAPRVLQLGLHLTY